MGDTTIHVAIGNSDDKLTQRQWSDYWRTVDALIEGYAHHVYGRWLSIPSAPFQNACWAFEVADGHAAQTLQQLLTLRAAQFGQDSIAWNESETLLLTTQAEVGVNG